MTILEIMMTIAYVIIFGFAASFYTWLFFAPYLPTILKYIKDIVHGK